MAHSPIHRTCLQSVARDVGSVEVEVQARTKGECEMVPSSMQREQSGISGWKFESKRVEVYLDSCSIRRLLETNHPRVSDHLGIPDQVLRLSDARVTLRDGSILAEEHTSLVNKDKILFVIDHTPRGTGKLGYQIPKDQIALTVSIGNLWLRGYAHMPQGADMTSFLTATMNHFMPLTGATVVGHEDAPPRTVLINRDRLKCVLTAS